MAKQNQHLIIFTTSDGKVSIDTRFDEETVWLSLDQMAELFKRDKSTVSRHIKNVFDEGELVREATVANFATVQKEGSRQVERLIEYFNLDVIISVGYRVKSLRGTQFRQWATKRINEYIRKGFTPDDERLKGGGGNRRALLADKGKVSRKQAIEKAEKELEIYRRQELQQLESDFDRALKELQPQTREDRK